MSQSPSAPAPLPPVVHAQPASQTRPVHQLVGDLDCSSRLDLAVCLSKLAAISPGPVVLDLSGITFIDVGGWRLLRSQLDAVRERAGLQVRLVEPSSAVRRLLLLLTSLPGSDHWYDGLLGADGSDLLLASIPSVGPPEDGADDPAGPSPARADLEQQVADLTRLAEQLQTALDSRVVIERAVGVLAERHGLAVGAAFNVLRRHARDQRRRLHEVAAEVLGPAGATRPARIPTPPGLVRQRHPTTG